MRDGSGGCDSVGGLSAAGTTATRSRHINTTVANFLSESGGTFEALSCGADGYLTTGFVGSDPKRGGTNTTSTSANTTGWLSGIKREEESEMIFGCRFVIPIPLCERKQSNVLHVCLNISQNLCVSQGDYSAPNDVASAA